MSDVLVAIVPPKSLVFTASEMTVRIIGGDPIARTTDLYIEIKNAVPVDVTPADGVDEAILSASGEFVVRLNATVNSDAFNAAVVDSEISAGLATRILQKAKLVS